MLSRKRLLLLTSLEDCRRCFMLRFYDLQQLVGLGMSCYLTPMRIAAPLCDLQSGLRIVYCNCMVGSFCVEGIQDMHTMPPQTCPSGSFTVADVFIPFEFYLRLLNLVN